MKVTSNTCYDELCSIGRLNKWQAKFLHTIKYANCMRVSVRRIGKDGMKHLLTSSFFSSTKMVLQQLSHADQ